MRTTLARAIGTLPERYQKVVFLYYTNEMTMKEIGDVLGVNESRVSQIHKTALKKMADGAAIGRDSFLGRSVERAPGEWGHHSGKREQIRGQIVQVLGRQLVGRHDGARRELLRVGEMLLHPTAAAPLGKAVERRADLHPHAVDQVAGAAVVRLVDQRALAWRNRARSRAPWRCAD